MVGRSCVRRWVIGGDGDGCGERRSAVGRSKMGIGASGACCGGAGEGDGGLQAAVKSGGGYCGR